MKLEIKEIDGVPVTGSPCGSRTDTKGTYVAMLAFRHDVVLLQLKTNPKTLNLNTCGNERKKEVTMVQDAYINIAPASWHPI